MSLTSQLTAAEDGLLAALEAEQLPGGGLVGVPVQLGDPGSGVRAPAHVWITEDAEVEQISDVSAADPALGGREELIELNVRCMGVRSGDQYVELRDAVQALAAAVEHAVANDRTLGGSVEDSEVVRLDRETGATDGGRAILLTVTVRARAWLGA